jgi:hypothetical protein
MVETGENLILIGLLQEGREEAGDGSRRLEVVWAESDEDEAESDEDEVESDWEEVEYDWEELEIDVEGWEEDNEWEEPMEEAE